MRVLCVAPYFYPKPGGLERYAYEICRRLAERHEIKVLCSNPSPHLKVISVRAFRISNTPIAPSAASVFMKLADWCDVVYAHTPVPYFADIALLFKKKPTVLVYHSPYVTASGALSVAAKLYNSVASRIHSLADVKVAVSGFVAKSVDADEIVEPGVDANFFRPLGGKKDFLLFVGQLSRGHGWKGLDLLLEAVRMLDAKLKVVGDGDMRGLYESLADRASVEFVGAISDAELVRVYSEAKLLVMPSKSDLESFGIVALEANACGTGVVATKVGGIPCYVRHGKNGILCEPEATSIAEAIEKALRIYRKLGKIGRRIAETYSWERAAKKTEEILIEAASSG